MMGQVAMERAKAAEERRRDWEWERYLSCTHVPHPRDRVAIDDFHKLMSEWQGNKNLPEALAACKASESLGHWFFSFGEHVCACSARTEFCALHF